MKLDESNFKFHRELAMIIDSWEKDSAIDPTTIKMQSIYTPKLHSKYLKILSYWKSCKVANKMKLEQLKRLKTRYYNGEMSIKELNELGWDQYQGIRPIKAVLEQLITGDKDVVEQSMLVEQIDNIISIVEMIINQIKSRDFQISNYIKIQQFENGV